MTCLNMVYCLGNLGRHAAPLSRKRGRPAQAAVCGSSPDLWPAFMRRTGSYPHPENWTSSGCYPYNVRNSESSNRTITVSFSPLEEKRLCPHQTLYPVHCLAIIALAAPTARWHSEVYFSLEWSPDWVYWQAALLQVVSQRSDPGPFHLVAVPSSACGF